MEQTAVEWLKLEIDSIEFQDPAAGKLYIEIQSLIEQALAMEKDQIVQAFNHGRNVGSVGSPNVDGDYYYEQIFKSK